MVFQELFKNRFYEIKCQITIVARLLQHFLFLFNLNIKLPAKMPNLFIAIIIVIMH